MRDLATAFFGEFATLIEGRLQASAKRSIRGSLTGRDWRQRLPSVLAEVFDFYAEVGLPIATVTVSGTGIAEAADGVW